MARLFRILIGFVIGLGLTFGWGWQTATHAKTPTMTGISPALAAVASPKATSFSRTHQEPNFYANN
jgi:hypothetical protein